LSHREDINTVYADVNRPKAGERISSIDVDEAQWEEKLDQQQAYPDLALKPLLMF
jgi:hypothetical protein